MAMTRYREPIDRSRRRMMTTAGIAGLAALAPLSVKADDPDFALMELWQSWQRSRAEAESLTQAASDAWSRMADQPDQHTLNLEHRGSATREHTKYTELAARAKAACDCLDALEQQIVEIPAHGLLGIAAKLDVALDHIDDVEGRAGVALRAALEDARSLGT